MAKTYTTIQGDVFDKIAKKCLGSTAFTGDLMQKNLKYIHYTYFPAGIVLQLPDVSRKASSNVSSLPPWKRGTT